jgi:hypothetical protein
MTLGKIVTLPFGGLANPNYIREALTLLNGPSYPSGAAFGRVTASCKSTLSAATGADDVQLDLAVLLLLVNALLADATDIVGAHGPSIVSPAGIA